MKEINNKTARHLDTDEYIAILECVKILEKAFKRKMGYATVTPYKENPDDIYGVAFAFDMCMEGYK